jgi:hypothetical protein
LAGVNQRRPGGISFESGEATIDAIIASEGLRLNSDAVAGMIRNGATTRAFERGFDDDIGKFRLTFWHERPRFRMVVDREGRVLKRLRIDCGEFSTPRFRTTR